jgi:hypothetical protein
MRWWRGRRISPAHRGVPLKYGGEAIDEAPGEVMYDEGGVSDVLQKTKEYGTTVHI